MFCKADGGRQRSCYHPISGLVPIIDGSTTDEAPASGSCALQISCERTRRSILVLVTNAVEVPV